MDEVRLLAEGEIELLGRMPYASNATFLVRVTAPAGADTQVEADPGSDSVDPIDPPSSDAEPEPGSAPEPEPAPAPGVGGHTGSDRDGVAGPAGATELLAIYKPARGERPLWDFPSGLYQREVAAWVLADHLGWPIVPTTVARDEGPFDEGSLQRFVEADPDEHYFTMREDAALHDQLRRIAAFDLVVNNTDRKGGHLLIDADRHIWCIDNGLAFHAEPKLRTVIWDFAGDAVPEAILEDLGRLLDRPLPEALTGLLDPFERDALRTRAQALCHLAAYPGDPTGHAIPWPLI